jgi:hypothetical protein
MVVVVVAMAAAIHSGNHHKKLLAVSLFYVFRASLLSNSCSSTPNIKAYFNLICLQRKNEKMMTAKDERMIDHSFTRCVDVDCLFVFYLSLLWWLLNVAVVVGGGG